MALTPEELMEYVHENDLQYDMVNVLENNECGFRYLRLDVSFKKKEKKIVFHHLNGDEKTEVYCEDVNLSEEDFKKICKIKNPMAYVSVKGFNQTKIDVDGEELELINISSPRYCVSFVDKNVGEQRGVAVEMAAMFFLDIFGIKSKTKLLNLMKTAYRILKLETFKVNNFSLLRDEFKSDEALNKEYFLDTK